MQKKKKEEENTQLILVKCLQVADGCLSWREGNLWSGGDTAPDENPETLISLTYLFVITFLKKVDDPRSKRPIRSSLVFKLTPKFDAAA